MFERDGGPVCHVLRMFGVETRRVRLGVFDRSFVEVLDGLQPGERVALTDVGSQAPVAPVGTPQGAGADFRQTLKAQPEKLQPQ